MDGMKEAVAVAVWFGLIRWVGGGGSGGVAFGRGDE